MKKFLIFTLIGIVVIVVLVSLISYYNVKKEKSFSPEDSQVFSQGEVTVKVLYNRPFKKGRKIYGGLVPYDKVWRTGANEATIFETNKTLNIEGQTLSPGKYSLWTIPGKEIWTVIFNAEYGQWGINSNGEANRNPAKDVLSVVVRPIEEDQVFEQFTISFEKAGEDAEMVLLWDNTVVVVPFSW